MNEKLNKWHKDKRSFIQFKIIQKFSIFFDVLIKFPKEC